MEAVIVVRDDLSADQQCMLVWFRREKSMLGRFYGRSMRVPVTSSEQYAPFEDVAVCVRCDITFFENDGNHPRAKSLHVLEWSTFSTPCRWRAFEDKPHPNIVARSLIAALNPAPGSRARRVFSFRMPGDVLDGIFSELRSDAQYAHLSDKALREEALVALAMAAKEKPLEEKIRRVEDNTRMHAELRSHAARHLSHTHDDGNEIRAYLFPATPPLVVVSELRDPGRMRGYGEMIWACSCEDTFELLFERVLVVYGWGVDVFRYFKSAASVPISELSATDAAYVNEVLCRPGQPGVGDPSKKTIRDALGLFDYSQDTPGILANPMQTVYAWAALSQAERLALIPKRAAAREASTVSRIKRGMRRLRELPSALEVADRQEADVGTSSEEEEDVVPSESEEEESEYESGESATTPA